MIAYKLFRNMKDGTIAPLFINKKARLKINEWLQAEPHLTKGFAFRPGWHCTLLPIAPHLSMKGRSWYVVEIEDFTTYNRPESQGGTWVLANKLKILEKYEELN
jgi:hypothetical protein